LEVPAAAGRLGVVPGVNDTAEIIIIDDDCELIFVCNNNAQTTCVSGWALGISCLFISHFKLQRFANVIEGITDFATK